VVVAGASPLFDSIFPALGAADCDAKLDNIYTLLSSKCGRVLLELDTAFHPNTTAGFCQVIRLRAV
jgi:hypothetical protein